jgi:hypothetical protein
MSLTYAFKKTSNSPNYGLPAITRIAQPTNADTSIVSGIFNEWLVIYGTHLESTQSVSFNGIMVPYDQLYATDTSISIKIPRVIPDNVTNTIEVITKGGTASHSFTVNIPPLKVNAILDEYTPIGDTLIIIGENFDLYKVTADTGLVVFTGGASSKVISATSDTIQVIVPQGAQPGQLSISGDPALGDLAKVKTSGWYMDNRNFLFDMNNYWGWNGRDFISSGPDPHPINGPYFKVEKDWAGGWAWAPFCSNNCAIPEALVDDPGQYINYALKFEMHTPIGSPALPAPLYMCFNSGDFKDYFYDPTGKGLFPFSTNGKWQTFTVPLKDWGNLDGFTFKPSMIMEFMIKAADPSQSNFSICNLRLVPIK